VCSFAIEAKPSKSKHLEKGQALVEGESLLQRRKPSVKEEMQMTEEHDATSTLSSLFARLESSGHLVKMDPTELCGKVVPPSGGDYNLAEPEKHSWSQVGQDEQLDKILGSIDNGFFIESGAADGELNSNTLFYEKKGWNGLLVEPNPDTFQQLLGKNRKSYAFNGALSTTGALGTLNLKFEDCAGIPGDGQCSHFAEEDGTVSVVVAPVDALLNCIGRRSVDFWSLDVEGVEQYILANTPFDDIEVGVMLIEMNKSEENSKGIVDVMTKYGFKEVGKTDFDRIYVNPTYFLNRGLSVPESV